MKKLIFCLIILSFISYKTAFAEEEFGATKCKTFTNWSNRAKNEDPKTQDWLYRPQMANQYVSPYGKFKIHYDMAGVHAVENKDINKNGVPDYIDSLAYYFDYVYKVEVEELGFHSPYPDDNLGGSEHIDIYVIEIGNGVELDTYYGSATPDGYLPSNGKWTRQYSFINMDNNYSIHDSTLMNDGRKRRTYSLLGIDAMKVTAAHEFHHAIQFIYGIPEISEALSVNEMFSTYMENRVFPESKDYMQYVKALLKNFPKSPFGDGNPENGYRYGIYIHYLESLYGDEIVRRVWEILESGAKEFKSINIALEEKGSSLEKSWKGFLNWLYYSGPRANRTDKYISRYDFPDFTWTSVKTFELGGSDQVVMQILPYEIRPLRYLLAKENKYDTKDTIDVLISNTDTLSVFSQNITLADVQFTLEPEEGSNANLCDYLYTISSNKSYTDTVYCRKGAQSKYISHAYPMPYSKAKDNQLFIPTPKQPAFDEKVFVTILDSRLIEVWSGRLRVGISNLNRVVTIAPEELGLNQGVYIYKVEYANEIESGKIVIVE